MFAAFDILMRNVQDTSSMNNSVLMVMIKIASFAVCGYAQR